MQPSDEKWKFPQPATDRRSGDRPESPPRRRHERLQQPCVAVVRGVDSNGQRFTESTVLNNVGAGGLSVKLQRDVSLGTRLLVVFAFSSVALNEVPAARLAAHGVVQRVDFASDRGERQGVGIQFEHYRFL